MVFNLHEHLQTRLKVIFEAEDDATPDAPADPAADAPADPPPADAPAEDTGDDLFSQEELDNAGSEAPAAEDTPADDTEKKDIGAPATPGSDADKMKELFTDSGDPEVDFGLTSEANVRLAKFKFKNAGIDPLGMMDETEHTQGVRVDELESRLTPDQYDLYRDKWLKIRKDFPKISEREQKVVIYNSNIPFFYNDETGATREITHSRDMNTAIEKLNKYLIKNFTENWVDNKKAVKFLQGVRINFSDEPKIRPNLISAKFFEEYEDRDLVPFNKLHSDIPESVRDFLKDNLEMDEFKKSAVFRTLANDYVGEDAGSSRTSVYAVIKGEEGIVEGDDDKDEGDSDKDSEKEDKEDNDSGEDNTESSGEGGDEAEVPEATGEAGAPGEDLGL